VIVQHKFLFRLNGWLPQADEDLRNGFEECNAHAMSTAKSIGREREPAPCYQERTINRAEQTNNEKEHWTIQHNQQ
jgi:hypothetical protein